MGAAAISCLNSPASASLRTAADGHLDLRREKPLVMMQAVNKGLGRAVMSCMATEPTFRAATDKAAAVTVAVGLDPKMGGNGAHSGDEGDNEGHQA